MAHVGMKPQSVHSLGGLGKIQRDEESLLRDAQAAEAAGAFAIVLELIPQAIAQRITRELAIPTIGIGAGPACDGQVLVSYDMLGLTGEFHPRFLKKFADLAIAGSGGGEPLYRGSSSRLVPRSRAQPLRSKGSFRRADRFAHPVAASGGLSLELPDKPTLMRPWSDRLPYAPHFGPSQTPL